MAEVEIRAVSKAFGKTRAVVDLLNRTFVTPFDRDDIYRLAAALDDICDHVDEAADSLALFGVKVVSEDARAQAKVASRSRLQIAGRSMRPPG